MSIPLIVTFFISVGNCFGPRGHIATPKEVDALHYGNCDLVPILDTLHLLPWMGDGKYRIGQIYCNLCWKIDGTIQEANTRHMAARQLTRLSEYGLRLLSSPEIEFRVFDKEGKPVFDGIDIFSYKQYGEHQQYHFEMCDKLTKAGVSIEIFGVEYGSGQFEFALQPDFGLNSLDQYYLFKDGVTEMYRQLGFTADFTSKPLANESGNGLHFNHSLWTLDGENNAMYDAKKKDNLSDIAKYWLGGIIKHAPALTALGCPTISCYRRLHTAWAPDLANWGLENRMAAFRMKSNGIKHTYLESRPLVATIILL